MDTKIDTLQIPTLNDRYSGYLIGGKLRQELRQGITGGSR